jgi:hypothetical protein
VRRKEKRIHKKKKDYEKLKWPQECDAKMIVGSPTSK